MPVSRWTCTYCGFFRYVRSLGHAATESARHYAHGCPNDPAKQQ